MLVQQYNNFHNNVQWLGFFVQDNQDYQNFMENNVRARLNDEEGQQVVENHLRSLVTTGFETDNLNALLSARTLEERDWAVGESFSEAILERDFGAKFPWNTNRDSKNENASLPGADIIGLINEDGQEKLLFGEVKTSTQERYPPNVLYGRSGMIHQLETIGTNLTRLLKLIEYLLFRCKDTIYETSFEEAFQYLIQNSNQGMYLVGILVRPNIVANEEDLRSRGTYLGNTFDGTETKALLLAYYLPQSLADFARLAIGGDR